MTQRIRELLRITLDTIDEGDTPLIEAWRKEWNVTDEEMVSLLKELRFAILYTHF